MEHNAEAEEGQASDEGFPWYVKAALAAVLLVILFVVGIDLVGMLGL